MADNSKIEWTDASWNPVTGCTKVSPGCDNCYAETFAERWRGTAGHHFENGFDVTLRPERLEQPLRWKKPRLVFVNSMSDLFHEAIPDAFIERVFDVMEQAKQHTFQVLTKRHGRMRSFVKAREQRWVEYAEKFDHCPTEAMRNSPAARWARERAVTPPVNIWLGVSVEDQRWADIRIPALLDTPAAVRWLSCEPLLGALDLNRWLVDPTFNPAYRVARCGQQSGHWAHVMEHGPDQPRNCPGTGPVRTKPDRLDWVVVGGESGPGARPMHPDWARQLRDQCVRAEVPYFFKQHGQHAPVTDSPGIGDLWLAADGATAQWQYGDGHVRQGVGEFRWPGTHTVLVRRHRGKHDAGRELDGRTWDEFPRQPEAVSA